MDNFLTLAHNVLGLPVLASKHGADVDKLIVYVHCLMGALFLGWILYFIYVLFRFNHKANPKADYEGIKGHASSYIELVVILVEAVLLIGFAVPLWARAVDEDQFPKATDHPVNIRVVAQQFAWNVFYPGPDGEFGRQDMSLIASDNPWGFDKTDAKGKDDFTTLNDIHVVVNQPVIITLTSKDVIHSFKVIAMRVTQDAIPGVRIPLHFTPTKPGVYQINCAQLCGNGHSSMSGGRITVESQQDYDKWVVTKSKAAAGGAASFE
ncbi:MAG TPA: cytochrome c oxidase subunit II [Verrucomicrobiae bacterium]|jgi:cytochrome c oxidase subunit 2|nr:cytochrome c oxidase subunit II [Verrucomicrobiae bacterium]